MTPLTVVSTPIGNLGDLSPRAAEALGACDHWIVEDTRISGKLQPHLGIKKPMAVLNDHSEHRKIEQYVHRLRDGETAVIVSDGGAPVVSDPGAKLIDAALDAGLEVDAIPGPSAVTTALSLSGFFAQRFTFLGFPPRKAGAIRSLLEGSKDSPLTLVLFESPFRLEALLTAAYDALGERRYAVCREMTKLHQQVFRATLPTIPTAEQVMRKGEMTVVFEGRRKGLPESD